MLTNKKIFKFWSPLAATWLMMAIEGPFVAAIIARLLEPKYNLAAWGVALSIALFVEAPIIMLMSASTALVKNKDSYIKLKHYTYILNAIITVFMLILIFPPVFYFVAENLIRLPRKVARLTWLSLVIFVPWPAAIGFRRFFQGILIRYNLTRRVAYGTVVRLVTMAATALLLFSLKIKGAYIGAAALSVGVIFESIVTRVMVNNTIKKIENQPLSQSSGEDHLTYRYINQFYYPLALTSMLALGIHPLVTFFMGRSRCSIESLAVLPVINALVFIFRSIGLSYQEVGIALIGEKKEWYIPIRNFALIIGSVVVLCLSIIAFTPIAKIWFQNLSGLSIELSNFSYLPTQILVILPGLTVLIAFQRSILVGAKVTRPITVATAIEVLIIVGVLLISIEYLPILWADWVPICTWCRSN